MDKLLQEMGARISSRRRELNYTQEALADLIGVSTQTISSAECGKKALRPENIVKLSTALNCTTDHLLLGGNLNVIPENLSNSYKNLTALQFQCLTRIIENYVIAISSIQE